VRQEAQQVRAKLTTPRAAAIAGILFSALLIAALVRGHWPAGDRLTPSRSRGTMGADG